MTNKEKIIGILIEKRVGILVICSLVILFPSSLLVAGLREPYVSNLRNVTDSFILLTELATESSEDYVRAKADHIEMLKRYVGHMESRHKPLTFVLRDDITVELKLAIKKLEEDEKETDQQMEACVKVKMASKAIAEFLSKHKLFVNQPIVSSKPEVISEEMQTTIKNLLDEAHKKTQAYINDLNMVNSEVAYRANRKVIVYLYLVRSQWSEVISPEERINLTGDINRTIYWNGVLKRSNITERERSRLAKHSANEHRHLRLLRAIMDNDMREVHSWLKLAIKKAFPNNKFFAEE